MSIGMSIGMNSENKMKNNITALKVHISLNVKDTTQSIKFYRKLFGIEPLKVRQGYAKFDVLNPPLNLALNQASTAGRGALSHLGIQVGSTEDVLNTKKQWEAAGLMTVDEMQTNCCFALQDKAWVTDPDGNEWEVFVVLEDDLQETNMCCVTGDAETITDKTPALSGSECCAATVSPTKINRETKNLC